MKRRDFLRLQALAAGAVFLNPAACKAVTGFAKDTRDPHEIARDESAWLDVQEAFPVDRSLINLNNGGVSPSPEVVQEAMARYLAFSHEAPAQNMNRVLHPRREEVRQRLAKTWGVDAEELAIVRNASEGLQACQFGFDLAPGDEVLTSTLDYPRMITTFRQRERRDGIVLRQIELPMPAEDDEEVVRRFAAAITPRTKLILCCHMINVTGQILPVTAITALGRAHGIPVIVDGAHALAHFDFDLGELDVDYYATSLHKWLHAPHGTGLLYVRREKIAGLWPLMAARVDQTDDIRKFEEFGTHPAANVIAIGDALTFHEGVGAANKQARLEYLRDRWARRLGERDDVTLLTSLQPGFACGIATVRFEGVPTREMRGKLWRDHRILSTAFAREDVDGLRISPSVYTRLEEVDRFADVVEQLL